MTREISLQQLAETIAKLSKGMTQDSLIITDVAGSFLALIERGDCNFAGQPADVCWIYAYGKMEIYSIVSAALPKQLRHKFYWVQEEIPDHLWLEYNFLVNLKSGLKSKKSLPAAAAIRRIDTTGINIDFNILSGYCMVGEDDFQAVKGAQVYDTGFGALIYIDRGASVLGIAHLDTVMKPDAFLPTTKGDLFFSPSLDDRLGAYILLEVLPSIGVNCDILLTTGEEIGASTACFFEPYKEYNWIFQFDRRGTDVVMYQYDNGDSRNLLQDSGFRAGIGSFSDICDLEHLKVKGFNFGTGYHNEHTKNCYCNRVEVAQQIALFRDFYNANYNTKMSHETRPIVYHKDDYPKSAYGMTQKDWGLMYCEICGKDSSDIDDYSSISKHGVCWSCLKNYSYSDTYDYSDWRM